MDRCDEADQRAIGAAFEHCVDQHRGFGGKVVLHPPAALLEPVIDQLLRHTLLDHRAIEIKGAVAGAGHIDAKFVQAENLPAADGQANLGRVNAVARCLVFIKGQE